MAPGELRDPEADGARPGRRHGDRGDYHAPGPRQQAEEAHVPADQQQLRHHQVRPEDERPHSARAGDLGGARPPRGVQERGHAAVRTENIGGRERGEPHRGDHAQLRPAVRVRDLPVRAQDHAGAVAHTGTEDQREHEKAEGERRGQAAVEEKEKEGPQRRRSRPGAERVLAVHSGAGERILHAAGPPLRPEYFRPGADRVVVPQVLGRSVPRRLQRHGESGQGRLYPDPEGRKQEGPLQGEVHGAQHEPAAVAGCRRDDGLCGRVEGPRQSGGSAPRPAGFQPRQRGLLPVHPAAAEDSAKPVLADRHAHGARVRAHGTKPGGSHGLSESIPLGELDGREPAEFRFAAAQWVRAPQPRFLRALCASRADSGRRHHQLEGDE
mmetsp:Transcript_4392/g.10739  ORF Transcript_4392/g.10739 Transcript_4392/m.10739 type:complete len:382 (+) Transcript_4392:1780-2925(+)